MDQRLLRTLFWLPRILAMLFIVFISLFSLDVFSENYSVWETLLALLIHLVPSFILIAALVLAWKQEWFGALLFIGFAGWYIIEMWGRFPWTVYLLMAGIPLLTGILFGLDWYLNGKKKPVK